MRVLLLLLLLLLLQQMQWAAAMFASICEGGHVRVVFKWFMTRHLNSSLQSASRKPPSPEN